MALTICSAGSKSALRLGVRAPAKAGTALDAHAWVECDGALVSGAVDGFAEYVPLSSPAFQEHHVSPGAPSRGWGPVREILFPSPRCVLGAYGLEVGAVSLALLPALYAHRGIHGAWKILTGKK